MAARDTYNGSARKIVFGIDIGATWSSISYSVLEPGKVPEIRTVIRSANPGQHDGPSRVPSFAWFDAGGNLQAIGIEAMKEDTLPKAKDLQWSRIEWAKLLIANEQGVSEKASKLPSNISIVSVFAHVVLHLVNSVKHHLHPTIPVSAEDWKELLSTAEFVIGNSVWGEDDKYVLREAIVEAELLPGSPEHRIHFVSEHEAALHFCLENGFDRDVQRDGESILLVDAGSSVVKLAAFTATYAEESHKYSFEEILPRRSILAGSRLVTETLGRLLEDHFKNQHREGAKYLNNLDRILDRFDKHEKLLFADSADPTFIKVGTPKDDEPRLRISGGRMQFDVALAFEPSLRAIIRAAATMAFSFPQRFSSVLLVGGFTANEWLFSKLSEYFTSLGLEVFRPDTITRIPKVISEGAIAYHIDSRISTCTTRFAYGFKVDLPYQPRTAEHAARYTTRKPAPGGGYILPGRWRQILDKGVTANQPKEFRRSLTRELSRVQILNRTLSVDIYKYTGVRTEPDWVDKEPDSHYKVVCTLNADMSKLRRIAKCFLDCSTQKYYQVELDVVLRLDGKGMEAMLAWRYNGAEQRTEPEKVDLGESVVHEP